ncbi:hypothetical protein DBV39_12495 [Orrella marina]|uniref:Uncharacterized protein n=1 Tax=Orrella marina TaxID=2163011 RepID=A0A2R4XKR7_9BURK|nr:hypothetical protein DBV39_12495 [Orrella marina]
MRRSVPHAAFQYNTGTATSFAGFRQITPIDGFASFYLYQPTLDFATLTDTETATRQFKVFDRDHRAANPATKTHMALAGSRILTAHCNHLIRSLISLIAWFCISMKSRLPAPLQRITVWTRKQCSCASLATAKLYLLAASTRD